MPINTQVNHQVQSGNNVVFLCGGVRVGLAQSVNASDSYGLDVASGIGDIHGVEAVPTRADHRLSVQTMMLRRGALLKQGIAVENGDGALKGLVFDIELYDKTTGELIRKYWKCSYDSGSLDVSKHAIVMQSGQFIALDVTGTGA